MPVFKTWTTFKPTFKILIPLCLYSKPELPLSLTLKICNWYNKEKKILKKSKFFSKKKKKESYIAYILCGKKAKILITCTLTFQLQIPILSSLDLLYRQNSQQLPNKQLLPKTKIRIKPFSNFRYRSLIIV
jgi:hypothetical protein